MNLNYALQFNKNKDAVLGLFCDPNFFSQHQALMGSTDFKLLEHNDDGNRCVIKFSYQVASDVPAFAKKILGDSSQVVHEEDWDRATGKGHISIDVATLPGTMECEARLEDNADGCRKVFDWEIKVKLPLIGGKIEKVVAEDIKGKSAPDQAAVNELLAAA